MLNGSRRYKQIEIRYEIPTPPKQGAQSRKVLHGFIGEW